MVAKARLVHPFSHHSKVHRLHNLKLRYQFLIRSYFPIFHLDIDGFLLVNFDPDHLLYRHFIHQSFNFDSIEHSFIVIEEFIFVNHVVISIKVDIPLKLTFNSFAVVISFEVYVFITMSWLVLVAYFDNSMVVGAFRNLYSSFKADLDMDPFQVYHNNQAIRVLMVIL